MHNDKLSSILSSAESLTPFYLLIHVGGFFWSSLQWRSRPQSFFLSVYSSSSLVLLSISFRYPFSFAYICIWSRSWKKILRKNIFKSVYFAVLMRLEEVGSTLCPSSCFYENRLQIALISFIQFPIKSMFSVKLFHISKSVWINGFLRHSARYSLKMKCLQVHFYFHFGTSMNWMTLPCFSLCTVISLKRCMEWKLCRTMRLNAKHFFRRLWIYLLDCTNFFENGFYWFHFLTFALSGYYFCPSSSHFEEHI